MGGPHSTTRTFAVTSCALALTLAGPSAARAQQAEASSLPDGVEVVRDLPYAAYGDRTLLLDLYRPTDRGEARLPTVVVIRGGGFLKGDKEGFGPIAAELAARGLAAVSIEYRTSREAPFPAAVMDTKAAVRWVWANADRYRLDPHAIGALGASAGGHLAAYLGVTAGIDRLEGDGGNPGVPSHISAVVSLAGSAGFDQLDETRLVGVIERYLGVLAGDDPELYRFASPVTHVGPNSPPLLLIHGTDDGLVPVAEALRLTGRYVEEGAHVELVAGPGLPHGFWGGPAMLQDTMDRAAVFFWRALGRR